jgi:Flp pilus assembly pilin Flp
MKPKKRSFFSFFLLKAEEGASALEYAILLASISVAIYSAAAAFGQSVLDKYSNAAQQFQGQPADAPAAPALGPGGGGNGDGAPKASPVADVGGDKHGRPKQPKKERPAAKRKFWFS